MSDFYTFQVDQANPTTQCKALVALYVLSKNAKENTPVASSDRDLDVVIASTES
ncbi:MAG: hypothetical protein ACSLEM_04755 [Candidatus Malihini olakiniferum]